MHFVGVDQSLNHTGLCILHDDGSLMALELIEPRKRSGCQRLAYIRETLKDYLGACSATVGVLEGYSFQSVNRKFDLGEVGAVVKLALYDASDEVYIAAPKQLKKFVCGRGSATKQDLMHAIHARWDLDIRNDNLADAYGLAQIARSIYRPRSPRRHELEVVLEITRPARVKEPTCRKSLA